MARFTLIMILACVPLAAPAADDLQVRFLEQEVRRLEQQIQALGRRIDELERPMRSVPPSAPRVSQPRPASDTWVDAAKWRRIRNGMSELEVIGLLGAPTSMREVDGARVLFYAMEIGTSGFLGGSVKLRDRAVIEVRQPVLQ